MDSIIPGLPDDVAYNILLRVSRSEFFRIKAVSKGWCEILSSQQFYDARALQGLSEPWLYASISDWKVRHTSNFLPFIQPCT